MRSAATPETCGVAKEVPSLTWYPPRIDARMMQFDVSPEEQEPLPPGAQMKVGPLPVSEYAAASSCGPVAPTIRRFCMPRYRDEPGPEAGSALPAATTTSAPRAAA